MRNEQEMLDLILDVARNDERIRAVILNGSRANPSALRDPFQDFDVVYLVTDPVPFRHNYEWISRFGELMILQLPDDMQNAPAADEAGFAYLMQFTDGNRIDLTLRRLEWVSEAASDSLTLVLLDKDGLVDRAAPASERDYLPKPPTAQAFADCCNEFWWVCPYVAKGLWRREIVYAKSMLDLYVREQLMIMIVWRIGVQTQFSTNPGKFGKFFEQYLEPELWELLLQTYAGAGYEHTWDALFAMVDLFRRLAVPVAEHFGFAYPLADDEKVSAHLGHVRSLPRDAKAIY